MNIPLTYQYTLTDNSLSAILTSESVELSTLFSPPDMRMFASLDKKHILAGIARGYMRLSLSLSLSPPATSVVVPTPSTTSE
jgi:hypothetical protein